MATKGITRGNVYTLINSILTEMINLSPKAMAMINECRVALAAFTPELFSRLDSNYSEEELIVRGRFSEIGDFMCKLLEADLIFLQIKERGFKKNKEVQKLRIVKDLIEKLKVVENKFSLLSRMIEGYNFPLTSLPGFARKLMVARVRRVQRRAAA